MAHAGTRAPPPRQRGAMRFATQPATEGRPNRPIGDQPAAREAGGLLVASLLISVAPDANCAPSAPTCRPCARIPWPHGGPERCLSQAGDRHLRRSLRIPSDRRRQGREDHRQGHDGPREATWVPSLTRGPHDGHLPDSRGVAAIELDMGPPATSSAFRERPADPPLTVYLSSGSDKFIGGDRRTSTCYSQGGAKRDPLRRSTGNNICITGRATATASVGAGNDYAKRGATAPTAPRSSPATTSASSAAATKPGCHSRPSNDRLYGGAQRRPALRRRRPRLLRRRSGLGASRMAARLGLGARPPLAPERSGHGRLRCGRRVEPLQLQPKR